MEFNPGFDIRIDKDMHYHYGEGVAGPVEEIRKLEDIRASLANPNSIGPELLYSIAMDVHCKSDYEAIKSRNLLFGVVHYAAGVIGDEPIRSQGHIHSISASCNASTCEVYEIFDGEAYIYMQESGSDSAGKCYAYHAKAGEVVVVPPGWVHATINANVNKTMTFGAWCVRDYGFDYEEVRSHHGIAFFPHVKDGEINWTFNNAYKDGELKVERARLYPEFKMEQGKPIYKQFQEDPDRFLFVSQPQLAQKQWDEMKEKTD